MAVTDYKLVYGTGTAAILRAVANPVQGGFYVIVNVNGSVVFGRGEDNETEVVTGANAAFLAYYDEDLAFQWVRQVKTSAGATTEDVAVDVVTGDAGVHSVQAAAGKIANDQVGEVTLAATSGFLARWDVSGVFLGAYLIPSSSIAPRGAVSPPGGGFLVCGSFAADSTFDPDDTAVVLSTGGGDDGYLARYDADGSLVFARDILPGASARQRPAKLRMDPVTGNVIVSGRVRGTGGFSPIGAADDVGQVSVAVGANDNTFYAMFDVSNGDVVWAKSYVSANDNTSERVAIKADGSIASIVNGQALTGGVTKVSGVWGTGEANVTTITTCLSVATFNVSDGALLNASRQGPMILGTTPSGGFSQNYYSIAALPSGQIAVAMDANGPILAAGIAREMGDIRQPFVAILDPLDPTNYESAALYVFPHDTVAGAGGDLVVLSGGDLVWLGNAKGAATVAEGSDSEASFTNAAAFMFIERLDATVPAPPAPVDDLITIKDSGGDYTDLASAVAAELTNQNLITLNRRPIFQIYNNPVGDVTIGTGVRSDYYRKPVFCAGAYGVKDAYKHGGVLFGGPTIYGRLTTVEECFMHFHGLNLIGDPTGQSLKNDVTAGPTNVLLTECIVSSQAGEGVYARNPSPASLTEADGCLFTTGLGVAKDNMTADSTGIATAKVKNCTFYGGQRGFRRVAGASTVQNAYALAASTAGFAGTIADGGGNASEDGSLGDTVSEVAMLREMSRNPTMLAAGTFEDAPTAAAGKIDRVALYRHAGSRVGTLDGDAAITDGVLEGSTGGITYAEAALTSVDDIAAAVRAVTPVDVVECGLFQSKAAADDLNRLDLFINENGEFAAEVYDATGVPTYFQIGMAGGKCTLYKDFADDSPDANHRRNGVDRTGTVGSAAVVADGKFTGIDDANSYLTYPVGVGSQVPAVKGAVVIDYDMAAQVAASDTIFAFRPSVATADNAIDAYRHPDGVLRFDVLDADGNLVIRLDRPMDLGVVAREASVVAWDGFDGNGTATAYSGVEGAAPASDTVVDTTRDEADTDGDIRIGALSYGGHNLLGNVYRMAVFNDTTVVLNGNTYDFTGPFDIAAFWTDLTAEYDAYAALLATIQAGDPHTYDVRVSAGTAYLRIDGTVVASAPYAGSRDATDAHQQTVGAGSTFFLGAGAGITAWGLFEGADPAPDVPLPYREDGVGMLDKFDLTKASSATLRTGGTAPGADSDVRGRDFDPSSPSIGAFSAYPKSPVVADLHILRRRRRS